MKKIKNLSQLDFDESYLVFVGYDYSPSGFVIAVFKHEYFEVISTSDRIDCNDDLQIFTLPDID